jgi:hypothetical protein
MRQFCELDEIPLYEAVAKETAKEKVSEIDSDRGPRRAYRSELLARLASEQLERVGVAPRDYHKHSLPVWEKSPYPWERRDLRAMFTEPEGSPRHESHWLAQFRARRQLEVERLFGSESHPLYDVYPEERAALWVEETGRLAESSGFSYTAYRRAADIGYFSRPFSDIHELRLMLWRPYELSLTREDAGIDLALYIAPIKLKTHPTPGNVMNSIRIHYERTVHAFTAAYRGASTVEEFRWCLRGQFALFKILEPQIDEVCRGVFCR